MGNENLEAEAAKKRSDVVVWLNSLFPDLNMTKEASEEDLRARLFDGTVLCRILNRLNPSLLSPRGVYVSSEQRLTDVKKFLLAMDEMGLPSFKVMDLEQGSISAVVECLLYLRDHINSEPGEDGIHDMGKPGSQLRKRWRLPEGDWAAAFENRIQCGQNSKVFGEGGRNFAETNLQHVWESPVISDPSAALSHQVRDKFYEVFQLKHGHYSDHSARKISEMMKSNSLENAPTLSLFSVINGILDESIDRKNGETPHRVALILRKVVQEIERRVATQSEHIINQNNLIKAWEEKYQSRIRVLETLANGTNEETLIVMNQLKLMKIKKSKVEEKMKLQEHDVVRLTKENENKDQTVAELKQELEMTNKMYEHRCQQLESKAKETKLHIDERIKQVEFLLAESKKKIKELESASESTLQNWSKKEHIFQNFIGFQLQSVQDLRRASHSIKHQVMNSQRRWWEEISNMGLKLKVLVDAAENYHTILAENQRLYNEVQELKGNIRVYCRIRPFLPGQNKRSTTIDFIGENGELLIANPSKQGKDGHRMFKFNKVYSPAATQAEVFLDIQPLIRSVLDGYNVCIFAYGQTGSGKTYTMTGPNSVSKEYWGVNYRALNDLFDISRNRRSTFSYEVGVQMVEIYNEQVRDLLSNDGSQKRLGIWSTSQPNGLAVPEASMLSVKSTSDVLELMQIGQANRAVGSTALNERSSRSHSVLTVHVRGVELKTGSTLRGCLHLIDLAGSERVERSEATGDRLKEAMHINKSLSALGDVIFALAQKSPHVPYRNSKLTQVLQSSLGGQAKTLMFVQINPDVESFSETISTLKFAERVSGVELGAARSNKEGKDVKDLMEQVAYLKDTIARKDEEIEQLQLLKDLRTRSNANSERYGNNLLCHSSSTPGILSLGGTDQQGQRLSDSEERLSDISDGGLSMGAEIDCSINSAIESTLFPEVGKPAEVKTEKIHKVPSRIPRSLPMKGGQATMSQSKLKDPSKSPSTKKATTSQATASLAMLPKHLL
ncbi:kinesin-like protein KIN-14C [Phoenix dactylifera]|uniref:Kinesin-like protein KIN-14C n=1 Tax=Phoenix dactylifera TaxID=42345 RepID=A0A8B7CR49_PHODC|nr:kinesin-like protein KIN-14C [Phoenix dactylifera]